MINAPTSARKFSNMASLDAVHLSPSATLAAMLLQADTHLEEMLQLIPTPDTHMASIQPDVNEELSSSDKENSSSYCLPKSVQVDATGLLVKTLLELSPTMKHMSFSPQRTRPPPRAWERRPATPYVPRNDGQRIWKRVPLQELGVDVNEQVSTREGEEKNNYLRVIKRQRLGEERDGTVVANKDGRVKAAGTRWEEENIEKHGSPKKKSRVERCDGHLSHPQVHDESPVCPETSVLPQANAVADAFDIEAEQLPSVGRSEEERKISTQSIPPHTENSGNDTLYHSGECDKLEGSTDAWEIFSFRDRQPAIELSIPNIGPTSVNNGTEAKFEIEFEKTASLCGKVDTPARLDQHDEHETAESTPYQALEAKNDNVDGSTDIPIALAMEVKSPESLPVLSGFDIETSNALSIPLNPPKSNILLANDQDETAFLRDFLERAQASKAARTFPSPQKKSAPSTNVVSEDRENITATISSDHLNETTDEIEDDDLSPPLETAHIQQMFSDTDATVSSPTRRSSRTATRTTSRLARYRPTPASNSGSGLPTQSVPLTLPSTIQLKRATGNEFVFNAKLQQSLAMLTRSNTKRNQFGALHVSHRLAQLKKEYEARERDETTESRTEVKDPKDVTPNTEDDAKSTSKKRKRGRQDEDKLSKLKRRVRWPSDEELLSFNEPAPFIIVETCGTPEEPDTIPHSLSEEILSESTQTMVEPEHQLSTEPNVTTSSQSNAQPNSTVRRADSSADSSKLKVRRIRKIKLDSVNGTPAPKTRSRSIPELEFVESESSTNTLASSSTSSTSSTGSAPTKPILSSTRKSSRMPIPISKPIPLPSLVGTDSKTKASHSLQDKNKDQARDRDRDGTKTPASAKPVGGVALVAVEQSHGTKVYQQISDSLPGTVSSSGTAPGTVSTSTSDRKFNRSLRTRVSDRLRKGVEAN